jgi:F-type H+-transporting ATPase subunit b
MLEFNGSFLIQLVNFFVMMAFLQIFLFKPVLAVVEKRNKTLDALRQDAQNLNGEAERIFGEYNAKTANLKKESVGALASARQQAVAEQDRLVKEARDEYSKSLETGLAEVDNRIGKVRAELKVEAEKLSRKMASNLLGRAL